MQLTYPKHSEILRVTNIKLRRSVKNSYQSQIEN